MADKSRAARACASCRKLKTRCYEARTPGASCLRCEKLGTECSLAAIDRGRPFINGAQHNTSEEASSSSATDARSVEHSRRRPSNSTDRDRLARLEKAMGTIAARFGIDIDVETASTITPSRPPGKQRSQLLDNTASSNISPPRPPASQPSEPSVDLMDTASAPVFIIRDLATEMGVESPNEARSARSKVTDFDLIEEGALTKGQAAEFLAIFHEHYGRWVFFDTFSSSEHMLNEVRKSPMLLNACCLIAVRHTNLDLAARLAPELFESSKSLVSAALLSTPQTLDFFQAALILSMWSTTVGQVPVSIDSWLLSGFAIQHCLSSDLFSNISDGGRSQGIKADGDLGTLKLWNHLCLVHLQ
ncbi:hypothetical protein H2200_011740 [Cladophialophora chaetospira]|uniref:Transcriptional activator of proteases prtT n=1 Tax=Cladophialophora chaetospira TaxID=386627 RepID=A0AA38WYL5_9EURO|nr:hypothetical protein H2200_011740 [Cladophialophora chaetospira]